MLYFPDLTSTGLNSTGGKQSSSSFDLNGIDTARVDNDDMEASEDTQQFGLLMPFTNNFIKGLNFLHWKPKTHLKNNIFPHNID